MFLASMFLFNEIDKYCERLSPDLLAEPINAVTNLAFIIAASLLWNLYRNIKLNDHSIAGLIILIAVIGIGSSLFHIFANGLTLLADIIPIMIFVFSYLYIALVRLLNFTHMKAIMGLVLLFTASACSEALPTEYSFNGSAGYFPCLIALLFIAWKSHKALIYISSFIFAISLSMRSIDMVLCPAFDIGTHFLWHILNGLLLYLLVKVLIKDCTVTKRM